MNRRDFLLAALATTIPRPRVVATIAADLHHVQGIEFAGSTLWVSSVDVRARKGYLSSVEVPSGRVLRQVELQRGNRIHPGGICGDGDALWLPVAEYDRDGPTTVERRDRRTLAVLSQFEVADHIGCVAASDAELAGGSWGSRTVYRWTKQGRELSRTANPSETQWQDLKFDRRMLIGSGDVSKEEGAVEWLSWPQLKLERRIVLGRTDRGVPFTHEGMAWRNGSLYLLPEDAPSRLFEFRPPWSLP